MRDSVDDGHSGAEGFLGGRHRDVLDAIRDVVLVFDTHGQLIDANQAAVDAYGYSRDELLGLHIRDLRAPETYDALDEQFEYAGREGTTFETVHVRKDGSAFPVEVSSGPIDLAVRAGVISVIRDVTARKEADELRARLVTQVSEANAWLDGALTLMTSAVGAADLSGLLGDIVNALLVVMRADAALFVVREDELLRVNAQAGSSEWGQVGTTRLWGEGFCGRVAEAGAPLYVADVMSSPAALPEYGVAGVRSMFGVPVYVDDDLFGVLECAWVEERLVDEPESAMVKLAAERIALAIANARLLDRSRRGERLNAALNEVNARLNASLELESALDDVLRVACRALGCDIALLGRATTGLWPVEHAYGVDPSDKPITLDPLLLGAMSSDEPLVFFKGGRPHEEWLTSRLGIAAAIAVPVPAMRGHAAALLFGRKTSGQGFDEQAIAFVGRMAQSLALSLANAAQFEAEHHIAETLQEALLLMPPYVRGLEFSHLYRSATLTMRVGGDFFDVFEMGEGRIGVLVGDVSGKGLQAAVLTSVIKDTIRAYAHETLSPAAAIAKANVALGEAAKQPDFATVFYAVVDPSRRTVTYCSAGHPPAAVVDPEGSVRLLEGSSPLIGAFPDLSFEDCSADLGPEDVVLLYTDGVTEARDASGAFFGEEGLVCALSAAHGCGVSALPAHVFDAVMAFSAGRLTDDVALLAFQLARRADHVQETRTGRAERRRLPVPPARPHASSPRGDAS